MKDFKKNKNKDKKTSSGSSSIKSGLGLVVERKEFYKDMNSNMWKIAATGVFSLVASIALSFFVLAKKENNVYFATDENGSLINMIALSEPNHKDATISNWLTRALVDTFDFNYHNLEFRINESSMKWFTSEGTSELIKSMQENGNFDVIRDRKMIVNLETEQSPIVVKKGRPDWSNQYLWKLEVPAKITYRTEASVYSNNVDITAIVSRRSLLEDPSGLGISSIIMTVRR